MKRFCKVLSLALVCLIMATPLFANGATEESAPVAEENDLAGTITFVCLGTNQSNGIKAAFDKYQESNPNAKLDLIVASTVTDFETMMTGFIASDNLPDMYQAQVGAVEQGYAANGYLLPLTDTGVMDNLMAGDRELISWDGDYYAFPNGSSVSCIVVNRQALTDKGIKLDETNYPKNFDQLIALFEECRQAGIEYPMAIAGKDASSVTGWTFQYIYQAIYGEDPNWYANILRGERRWDDDLYLSMFDKYAELRKYITPNALGNDVNAMNRTFLTGESPFIMNVMHAVGNFRKLAPNTDFFCIPSCFTTDEADQTIIAGFDDGISICKTTDIKDLCIDFLRYLVSDEGSTIYTNTARSVPTTKVNHAETDPAYSLCLDILQNNKLPVSPVRSRQWIPGIKEVMKSAQQNWFAGADPEVVAAEIQTQHDRIMAAKPEWVENFLNNYKDI